MAQFDLALASEITDLQSQIDALDARLTAVEGAPSTQLVGVVQLASFSGATWDDKLDAALAFAAAQPRIPYIQFPAGDITLNRGGRTPFTGMKLLGPNSPGFKHLEVASGVATNHRVTLGSGITTGANSLFHGTTTVYGVYVGNLTFSNNHTAQFWSQTGGSIYSGVFDSLTFFGMKHIFGNNTQLCAITWCHFIGHWNVHAFTGSDQQFHLGGSDGTLWMDGGLNIAGRSGTGEFMIRLNTMWKTSVGKIFFTVIEGWRGLRVSNAAGLSFFGTIVEGQNESDPCHGCLVRFESGNASWFGGWIAYAMSAPSSFGGGNNGVVEVIGASCDITLIGINYRRAVGVAETVPFVYCSAGRVSVKEQKRSGTWTGLPRVQDAGGDVVATDGTWTLI
jgi:hypothetical protein